jgi:membrane fusion protein (multidrug efflux system)
VRQKRAERDRAELDLKRTTITAPISGTAVNVRLQPGDQLKAATPISWSWPPQGPGSRPK